MGFWFIVFQVSGFGFVGCLALLFWLLNFDFLSCVYVANFGFWLVSVSGALRALGWVCRFKFCGFGIIRGFVIAAFGFVVEGFGSSFKILGLSSVWAVLRFRVCGFLC